MKPRLMLDDLALLHLSDAKTNMRANSMQYVTLDVDFYVLREIDFPKNIE